MAKSSIYLNSRELTYQQNEDEKAKATGRLIQYLSPENETVTSVSYLSLKFEDKIYLPIALFRTSLTPLRAIVKYLKEELYKTNTEIANLLNRDPRIIWATYKSVEKTKLDLSIPDSLSPEISALPESEIPLDIFSDANLSALEALVSYLHDLGFGFSEIARALRKDPRTIWTVYARAKRKSKGEKKPS